MGKGKDGDKTEGETYPDLRYGPLNYSIAQLHTYLSPEQKETLQQFRDSIPTIWPEPLTGVEELFLSDSTLCRYLRAREWHLSKAQKMLVETLKWRREYKPWAITAADVDPEMNNLGKMYRGGYDKHDRPILIMKPRHDNTHGSHMREVKVKYLVYCLEKCIRAGLEKDREKIGLLIDFSKNSGGFSNIGMALDVLKILSDHYPERLGNAWIIGASWSFTLFWKGISPFLDSVTKKKIFFINKLVEFKDWIDDEVLEVEYGGNNDFVYSYEAYKGREDGFFPPHTESGHLVHPVQIPDSDKATDEPEDEEDVSSEKKKHKKSHKKHKKAKSKEDQEEDSATDEPSASAASAPDANPSAEQDASSTTENEADGEKTKKKKKSKKSDDATAEDDPSSSHHEEDTSAEASSQSKPKKSKKSKAAAEGDE